MRVKPAVIDVYLIGETLRTWAAVTLVLLVLTLGVGFARYIADAAAGEIPMQTVALVAGLSAVENMEVVLPVSVLLALLLTVGRLCRDNEMAAMTGVGIGPTRLYRAFAPLTLGVALLCLALSLVLGPAAARHLEQMEEAGAAILIQAVEPGRFTEIDGGKAVFYAGGIDSGSGLMRDVFIRVARDGGGDTGIQTETIVTAETARYVTDTEDGTQTLVLRDGRRYEGRPGQADFRVTRFAEHGLHVARSMDRQMLEVEQLSPGPLFERDSLEARIEWQSRLAVPVTVLVLAFLALPLGQQPPRSGRYARLIVGILVFVGYVNLLRLGEIWMRDGSLPVLPGLWLLHGLVLATALLAFLRSQGHLRRQPALAP